MKNHAFHDFGKSKNSPPNPRKSPPRTRKSPGALAQGHHHESPRAWEIDLVGFGWSWCEALSSLFVPGGPFGQNQGVLLWQFFFVFNPKFSLSKADPETKGRQSRRFQTMRNPILLMIFLWDHGVYYNGTAFGQLLGSFLKISWFSQSESTRINPKPSRCG